MRLTAFSDVSLRVLMLLSALEPGQKLSTQKIAEGVDTPYNHVAKAVAFLVNQGYLDSTRGRSGGVMLSESGRSVTVGTILRATEGDIPMIECEDENGHCPLDKFCRLRNVLARFGDDYRIDRGCQPRGSDPSGARNGSSGERDSRFFVGHLEARRRALPTSSGTTTRGCKRALFSKICRFELTV